MNEIDTTILAFENYNDLEIEEYVSPPGRASCSGHRNLKTDKYIGKDIFKKNIEKWLTLFDSEDQSFYLDLLKRYRYYPEQAIKNALYTLANKIKIDSSLPNFEDIYFVTIAPKDCRVSGGDNLRAYLRTELELDTEHYLLDTSRNLSDICKKAKVIVFLDDVAGTGKTMYSKITSLISELKLTEYPGIKLYAAFICANQKIITEKVKSILRKTNVTIIPAIHEMLAKELSKEKFDNEVDHIHALDVTSKYDRLIYENKYEDDKEQECIRGFDNSQLLLSFCYNTPNNTIAAFWRPSKISDPLFRRDNCQSMSIDDLKTGKEQARRIHYFSTERKNDNQ